MQVITGFQDGVGYYKLFIDKLREGKSIAKWIERHTGEVTVAAIKKAVVCHRGHLWGELVIADVIFC